MTTPIVIDLSHHNTIPKSLQAAKDSGIIGVIHKATEGASYVDDMLDNRWYLTSQVGLLWGTYHFMRPGDMKQQAAFYVDTTNANGDENTLLAADHEDADVSLDDLKEFLTEVERLTGRKPVIYSGHVLREQLDGKADPELADYLLWLADYSAPATLPPGFASYWLWQYTDEGTVPGITPPTDLNTGDVDGVTALWSGSAFVPIPEPGPEPELAEVTVDFSATPGCTLHIYVNGASIMTVSVPAE